MADQAHARTTAGTEDDNAEWRPFQVWASQMRSEERPAHATSRASSDDATGTWDPYQVWKRHVQQSNTPDSDG